MRSKRSFVGWATVGIIAVAAGCGAGGNRSSGSATGDPEADRRADLRVGGDGRGPALTETLYSRLGGDEAITRFVDDFTMRVIADPE